MGKINKKERHIRWNWEKSPDDFELVRYHFVVVDDKDRKGKIRKILDSISSEISSSYSFVEIRSVEGKVEGTDFRYLFESYDTFYSPTLLNMNKLFKNAFKDKDLYERKRRNVEDYVADRYSNNS
ncbi:MAG TPA: hypothetical protein PK357_00540 [Candidatus Pacearchaeota archaeon]|nr:hypothetical protein [Candidatus Pacearchaeota archaeon]